MTSQPCKLGEVSTLPTTSPEEVHTTQLADSTSRVEQMGTLVDVFLISTVVPNQTFLGRCALGIALTR